jgi:hypothetical protein
MWGRGEARAALVAIAAAMVGLATVGATATTRPSASGPGDTDSDLFRKVATRVHAGGSPYDAFERVFRGYDYPVRSAFNYRLPTLYWFLGHLPGLRWGQAALGVLMVAAALASYAVARGRGGVLSATAIVLLMQGAFAYGFVGDVYLYAETWAGALIVLSACAYALGHRAAGTAAGFAALAVRELALPYGVASAFVAWRAGRRREASAWGVGLVVYGAMLWLHIRAVAPRLPHPDGLVNGADWVHFGGPAFLLATARINLILMASPAWVTALYLSLALVGIAAVRGEFSTRVGCTVGLYLAAFSVVGGLFNAYWGLLFAPLLPFGVAAAPAALRDLLSAGFGPGEIHTPTGPEEGEGARRLHVGSRRDTIKG